MQKAPASRVEARTFWQRWLSSDQPTKACSADDWPRPASAPCAGAPAVFPSPGSGGGLSLALGAISEARPRRRVGRDPNRAVLGKRMSLLVSLGGRRYINKKTIPF